MKLPKYFTTVTPFSKALAMILFIALPFVGFWFGVKYQTVNKIVTTQPKQDIQNNITPSRPPKEFVIPTSSYTNMQKFDELNWKKYSNSNLGISFDYPDNLTHFGDSQSGALKIESEKITLTHNMSYIFQIEKIVTNDSVETWWDKNDSSKHNGNGLMPANMTKTAFHNRTAYYFETRATEQVPTDYYIIPFNGYFLQISFSKITPYRDALWSCVNVSPNPCTTSDLYSMVDYDNHYRQFHDLIIQRILGSISFEL